MVYLTYHRVKINIMFKISSKYLDVELTRNIFKKIFGGSQILTILTQLNDEIPLYPLFLAC